MLDGKHMIEINIWKCWIRKQFMTKFGRLKIDNGGDTMINSDAIYHSNDFVQNVHRQAAFFCFFLQFPQPFVYRQNRL